MIPYFSRVNYFILDDLAATNAVTGVDSRPFVRIFATLIDKVIMSSKNYISDNFGYFNNYQTVIIILNVIYCMIALIMTFYLRNTVKQIDNLLKFIDDNNQSSKTSKKVKSGTKQIQNSAVSIKDMSDGVQEHSDNK